MKSIKLTTEVPKIPSSLIPIEDSKSNHNETLPNTEGKQSIHKFSTRIKISKKRSTTEIEQDSNHATSISKKICCVEPSKSVEDSSIVHPSQTDTNNYTMTQSSVQGKSKRRCRIGHRTKRGHRKSKKAKTISQVIESKVKKYSELLSPKIQDWEAQLKRKLNIEELDEILEGAESAGKVSPCSYND